MSNLEDHQDEYVAIHVHDVKRWLAKLQLVPGFSRSDSLLEICIDIVSTVEVASVVDNPPNTCDDLAGGNRKTESPEPQLVQ
ncbi:hypothetical protein [Shimia sp. MIT1388]|uniref:hypothetical protein n=1 Tax=Shimia sp. MIT1388 TaxID=3096992 RepID=UPI00399A7BD4